MEPDVRAAGHLGLHHRGLREDQRPARRRIARVVLRVRQVRSRLPRRPGRRLRPQEDPPPGPDGRRPPERPQPVAVHDLHELPPGLPEGSRHDQDHAGGAGGGRRRRATSRPNCRTCSRRRSATATAWGRTPASATPGRRRPACRCGSCRPADPGPVDVLVWVEDYWSYHPRGQEAARAFARVATALGVDWAIVGPEEKTVADSQRLAGEKGLFEAMMEDVVATLGKYQFNRIVTPDPARLQRLHQGVPEVRARVRGAALHAAAGAAHGPGQLRQRGQPRRHVPRPLLPRPPRRGVRRAPRAPQVDPRV